MKKFYTLLLFLFATVSILAQAPEKMSYQAVLRYASNTLLTNQQVGIQISILQTTITGSAVYTETQIATTNINGLVSLEIGSGTSSDDFSAIDWSAGPYFIKTETDPAGGTTYTITGTSQLMSVPFAMYAKTSGNAAPGPQGAQGTQGIQGATGTAGTNGTQGIQGAAGADGTNGIQGTQGAIGTPGADGAPGVAGTNGTNGTQGTQGATGTAGTDGTNGTQGAQGATGTTGAVGTNGTDGTQGTQGATGADGTNGIQGTQGATGTSGTDGTNGIQGIQGATGTNGTNGTQGIQGATGTPGASGTNGTNGRQGTHGADGATGPTGQQGLAGNDGATGLTGPQGTIGLTGATGQQGLAGNDGATGATGLQGPAGNDGATGATGLQGPAGNDGATGLTGPQGTIGLTGPTGPAGSLGPQGIPGVDGVGIAQTLSFTSPNLVLSDNGGSIDLTGLINDADSDNSNEIQNLSQVLIEGNTAGSQLKNVTDPTDAQDATTKAYVDALIATLEARLTALEPEPAVIGELREGGVVFWVDPADNTHGLVCALSDDATQVAWGCSITDLPNVPNVPFNGGNPVGLGAEIGDGESNTNNILNGCPSAPAALAARSLGPEWFLPSAKELNEMYIHETTLEAVSGFSAFSNFYWSSTETDANNAWYQSFVNGNHYSYYKVNSYNSVRAVRAF
jgi:hypothetical protein